METEGGRAHPSARRPSGQQTPVHAQMRVPGWSGQAQTCGEGWAGAHQLNGRGSSQLRPVLSAPGAAPTPPHIITTHTHHRESGQRQGEGQTRAQKGGTHEGLTSFLMLVCVSLKQHSPRKEWGDHGVSARLIWIPTCSLAHSMTSDKLMDSESTSSGQTLAENTHSVEYR